MPTHPVRRHRLFVPHAAALCAALMLASCAHAPDKAAVPPVEVEPPVARTLIPGIGPPTVVPLLAVYRTQQADPAVRERCGERIAPQPARSLWSRWFSSEPTKDTDIPPPMFEPQRYCDSVAAPQLQPAHWRVIYMFQGEQYTVDLDYDPGNAVLVNDLGRVVGREPMP